MNRSFRVIPGSGSLKNATAQKQNFWQDFVASTPEIVTKGDLAEIKVTWFCLGILAGIVAGVCL